MIAGLYLDPVTINNRKKKKKMPLPSISCEAVRRKTPCSQSKTI